MGDTTRILEAIEDGKAKKSPFSPERLIAAAILVLSTGGATGVTNMVNSGSVSDARIERDAAQEERESTRAHYEKLMQNSAEQCREFVNRCEAMCK